MIQSPQRELGQHADMGSLRAAICTAAVSVCLSAFRGRLRGIVLSGSLARCEGTFIWNFERWNVLGDAEFFLVFEDGYPLPQATRTAAVRQEVERGLISHGLHCQIDLSPVHANYLMQLQPHILAYEMKQCGQVIWGDPDLLALIPPFAGSDIFLEDAWRLLSNRMVEYLAIAPDLWERSGTLSSAVFYRTVKLYLDMATSLLLFIGEYEPTYAERAARLRGLLEQPPGVALPFPLPDFTARVDFCTGFKLQQSGYRNVDPAAFAGDDSVSFWTEAVEYAHRLWRWQLVLLAPSENALSDSALMLHWMRRQPIIRRVRGWVRVFRDSGWACWREWPRWALLACRASPRHCVYAIAAEMFFRLPELVGVPATGQPEGFDTASMYRWLPFPPQPLPTQSGPPRISAMAAVFSNYQRFVAVTRA